MTGCPYFPRVLQINVIWPNSVISTCSLLTIEENQAASVTQVCITEHYQRPMLLKDDRLLYNLASNDLWHRNVTFDASNICWNPFCNYDSTLVATFQKRQFLKFHSIFQLDILWLLTLTCDHWLHQNFRCLFCIHEPTLVATWKFHLLGSTSMVATGHWTQMIWTMQVCT